MTNHFSVSEGLSLHSGPNYQNNVEVDFSYIMKESVNLYFLILVTKTGDSRDSVTKGDLCCENFAKP